MKRTIAIAALALVAVGSASAQVKFKARAGGGFTYGGDTIATMYFQNGTDADVRAGGQTALHGGVELRFSELVSAQALVGYQSSSRTTASASRCAT